MRLKLCGPNVSKVTQGSSQPLALAFVSPNERAEGGRDTVTALQGLGNDVAGEGLCSGSGLQALSQNHRQGVCQVIDGLQSIRNEQEQQGSSAVWVCQREFDNG